MSAIVSSDFALSLERPCATGQPESVPGGLISADAAGSLTPKILSPQMIAGAQMPRTKANAAYLQEAFRIGQEVARSGRSISDLPFLPTLDERQLEKEGWAYEADQIAGIGCKIVPPDEFK